MRCVRVISMVWAAALVCGCARHTAPVVAPPELTAAERNFQALWDASLETLQQYRFTVDRRDRRAGVITALPMNTMHVFEFWRRDAVLSTDLAESTLQTLYKSARVTIRPSARTPDDYAVRVRVEVYRSDRPSPQVTSTSEAFDLFLLPSDEDIARRLLAETATAREGTVTPLGRDLVLEKRLEMAILTAAGKAPAEPD